MDKGGGSRLLQMQARFQQKQMQEREMKIASLYESQQARALDRVRHSPSNGVSANTSVSSPPQPAVNQPGKVRQMFEERRTKGIDKSYPLQPIHNTERTRKALPNGYSKVTNNTRINVEKKTMKTHTTTHTTNSVKKVHKIESIVNGSGDLNHNHEPNHNIDNIVKHQPPHSNGDLSRGYEDVVDKCESDTLLEDETFPEALAPAPTPRSPHTHAQTHTVKTDKPTQRRSPPPRTSPTHQRVNTSGTRRATGDNNVTEVKPSRGAMQKSVTSVPSSTLRKQAAPLSSPQSSTSPRSKSSARVTSGGSAGGGSLGASGGGAGGVGGSGGGGVPCGVCGRRFAADRLDKHQDICRRAANKKRKPFDALKHRLAGTEAEPFISKLRKGPSSQSTNKKAKPLNSSWRQKHEEFIAAIRAAKQVQAHIAAGGKLSDLPPPPPSENPDYVQCPHCARRFNQSAADRHIPKCKNYQFNKPKPQARKR